jgi:hypothetical protein
MAKATVYIVVERELGYNDCFYDFTGAERAVLAFRSRQRAEALARELSAKETRVIDPDEGATMSHHVIEAEVEV